MYNPNNITLAESAKKKVLGSVDKVSSKPNTPSVIPQQVTAPIANVTSPMQNTGVTPYVDPFLADNEKLRTAIKQPNQAAYDYNTDPAFQALKSTYGKLGQTSYENTLGSKGDTINTAIASAASQAKLGYDERLMALVPGMQQNNYNQQQDTYNNQVSDYNRGLERSALAYTQSRNAVTDSNLATDRTHKLYSDSIAGLGDNMDYSQAIKDNQGDGDTTNDWKIPYLAQEKTKKQAGNLDKYAATAGQYNNDYQQEINNLTKINPNDPKIPILKAAQQMKVEKLRQEKITKDAADIKNTQTDNVLNENIRNNKAVEGIGQQNANTAANKATTTPAQTKAIYANAVSTLKGQNLSVAEMTKTLTDNEDSYLEALGRTGYINLWNDVLANAIAAGQTTRKTSTPSGTINGNDLMQKALAAAALKK